MFKRSLSLVLVFGALGALTGCASGSKYQGLDAAGVFRLAQEEYDAGEYGDAAETLDRLLLVYPTFEQAAEAYFLMAEAYFRDEQYITSSSEYTRFLDLYPAHPNAPVAALGVCRSYSALSPISQRDQTFTEQALTVCRNVVADYQGRSEAQDAARIANEMREKLARKVYESGHYYLRRDFFDSAIIYFEEVVDTYPDTEWAPRALAGIIEAYEEIGYEEEVELARTRLLSDYPDSPEARALGDTESGGASGGSGS
jgi:outer membrane protein assembly factor BamD